MALRITVDTADATNEEVGAAIDLLARLFPEAPISATLRDNASTGTLAVATAAVSPPPPPVEPAPVTDPAVAFGTPTVPLDNPDAASATGAAVSPAPAPVPATTAPPVATSSPSSGVIATDRNGFPWDARIHSTPAKLNAGDGLWRAKRGVSNALQTQVEAELRQTMAAPPPAPPAVSTPATSASVTDASGASAVPPAQAQALADASAPELSPAQKFANLMRKVTPAQTAGKLTVVDIGNVCAGLQIPSLSSLMTRPDLTASAEEMIDALIAAAA